MTSSPRNPSDATVPDDKSDTGKDKPARTLGNRPVDPNAMNQKGRIPPGVEPDTVWDPGSATPDAPPVDNRS